MTKENNNRMLEHTKGKPTVLATLGDGLLCAIAAIAASLPLSILFPTFFRFPIPFVGYESGFKDFHELSSFISIWFFYVILGGFVLLGVAGGTTGVIISSKIINDRTRKTKQLIKAGIIVAAVIVALFSILDLIIGPW